ncbi:hypothetical protein sos41_43070 [Alphaproteobacteria bacterium SO-S41]|nr:hypothetical protein sos41_43070 [Alphaproteobacteria bacterium SO-S41]
MSFFKRTASALAIGLALAGGAALVAPGLAPAAWAQESAEARFADALRLYGVPDGLLKWASVEETGYGFIAHGIYVDLAGRNLGVTTIPLGDLELTEVAVEDGYVTHLKGRFTNIKADLAELMTAGQQLGQSQAGASLGMGVVMMAGYVQGLGYQTVDIALDIDSALDFGTGIWVQSGALDIATAFRVDFKTTQDNVTPAYVDWARANGTKMLIDPAATAEATKAALADPNSPVAKVGYAAFDIAFDDQGLMAKLEPQLAPLRAQFLGTNADGTPKTELTEADLLIRAQAMGGKLAPEKLLPLVRAAYNFVMKPDVIAVAVKASPAFTLGEFQSLTAVATGAAPTGPAIDWNSRVTLDAHN